ncbi:MAG: baseplate J/gp47 family protein [Bradymonadaceae bacterium]
MMIDKSNWGLSDKGFYVPTYDEILQSIREEYEARINMSIDWVPENALTEITAVFASTSHLAFTGLGAVYGGTDPDTATGYQLDAISALTGVRRLRATYSAVVLTLTGDPGVTVPEGKMVEDSQKQRWMLTEDATIGTGGTVDAVAMAVETGPVAAGPGTVTIIVTPVFGWLSVTNAAAATPGRNRETDGELRLRRQQSLQVQRGGSLKAIRRALLELEFIRSAVVLENDTDSEQVIAGMDVPAHSVVPVIFSTDVGGGLSLATSRELVARTLYASVVAGVKCYGEDDSATLIGGDGVEKTIEWTYASGVTVNVAVTVTGVTPSSIEEDVEDIVKAYFDGLAVGEDVRRLPIVVAVGQLPGVTSVSVALNGSAADIPLTEIQVGVIGTVTTND